MNKTQLLTLEQLSYLTLRELQSAQPKLYAGLGALAQPKTGASMLADLPKFMDVPLKDNPFAQGELQQARLYRLGDLCELSQRKVKTLLAQGCTIDMLDDVALTALVVEKHLKKDEARQLGLAAGLFQLFEGDLELTRAVKKSRLPGFGNRQVKQLRQLAALDAAKWLGVLRKVGITPPDNTSLEEYAEHISCKVAALYPTDAFFTRLTPVQPADLSRQIKRIKPLFKQASIVFDKPGFERMDTGAVEAPELESFRQGYERLAKQANKIPGMAGLYPLQGNASPAPAGSKAKAKSASARTGTTPDILKSSLFERLKAGSLKPATIAKLHGTYMQLKRFANRYHGLELVELLDDPALTPDGKAKQVAARVSLVERVRTKNPDVELLKLDYAPGSADIAALHFDGLGESEQSMVLNTLRASQRVYVLTRNVDHARAILEAGYVSSTGIASTGFAAFVESTGLQLDAARRYYDAARNMTITVGAGLGAAMDSNWGGFRWLNVCNTRENYQGSGSVKLDDYESLFGSQTYCNCKHCQSIFSPAAYFVDLMYFLEKNTTYLGNRLLYSRRPDLWTVELTCENTDTEIPTLDIVNEILGNLLAQIIPGTSSQQEQVLLYLQMFGSFQRPFSPALEKLAGCLTHFDVTRAAIAREMKATPATQAKAVLGIVSPGEYQLIAQKRARTITLAIEGMFYGIDFSLDASTGMVTPFDVQEFLKPLGIGRPDLDELVKTRFVNGGIRIVPQKQSPQSVQFDIEKVEHLTLDVLDRIQRFARLWHHLPAMDIGSEGSQWTILELDLVLYLLGSSHASSWRIDLENLAIQLTLQERFGLSLMETCGLWCKDLQEVRLASQPASTSLFDRLFNPSALAQAGMPFPRPNDQFVHPAFLSPGQTSSDDALHRLHAGLKVDDEELYQLIVHLEKPLGLNLAAGTYGFLLSTENLSLLYRHARLSKLLGLTIPEFFQLLKLSASGALAIQNLAGLTVLLDFYDWWQASGYKLDELGFITGGTVLSPDIYPDPQILAGQIEAKAQADKVLEFADTIFAFLEGVTEAQSRQIITANPTIMEAVNPEKTIYRLAGNLQPTTRLTIPGDVIKAVALAKNIQDAEAQNWLTEQSWAELLKYHPSEIIPSYLAALMNVSVEKMNCLVVMSGVDQFDPLFVQILRGDQVPTDQLNQLVDQVLRLNVLFEKLAFDPATLDFISDNWGVFSITDPAKIDVSEIRKLSVYLSLMEGDGTTAGTGSVKSSDISSLLLDLNTWLADSSQIALDLLAQELSNVLQIETGLATSLLNSISLPQAAPEAILRLALCAKLVRRLGVGASVLPSIISDDYDELVQASEAVLAAYKAGYQDDAEWESQIMPIDDTLCSGRRDAFCHALSQIGRIRWGKTITRNDLYDQLLIDVELEGCARTSRVVAAISSVQLYIQRILMNLEGVQPNDPEMAEEWEWRKNYRLWEANRKVFLYPENYIEPDLRDDKTPLFEDLETKLLQQEITPQNVLDAYSAYLSGFEEAARLKIAGSYHDIGANTDTLHLFGVTPETPPTFYYRAVKNAYFGEKDPATHGIDWSYWRKVSVQIPVRKVSPIVYNGRLYVFWVEITTTPKNDVSNGTSKFAGYRHKMSVKYTTLRLDGTWTMPQGITLIEKDVFPMGEGTIDDPLLSPDEIQELIKLQIDLQMAIAGNPPEIADATNALVKFFTTKMVTPEYDPDHRHLEPQDGYTLTGFQWDRVYPSIIGEDLVMTGRNYMMRGAIDFYRKAILPLSNQTPASSGTVMIPTLLPVNRQTTLIPISQDRVLDCATDDGAWRLWNYDPTQTTGMFPGNPLAQGRWDAIQAGHTLVLMVDRKVLDWAAADGAWRLWICDPANPSSMFQETDASGAWGSIRTGHTLIPMHDGRVLDWIAADGTWRLWNYDSAQKVDIFPGNPVAQGQWKSIHIGHTLIPMQDGRVLDWVAADGTWRLWNYVPTPIGDIFPGNPVAQGKWNSIQAGHSLTPMQDGHVLDLTAADGTWRLWNYVPAHIADIFPGNPVAQGQRGSGVAGHALLDYIETCLPLDGYASCSIFSPLENIIIYNSFLDQKEPVGNSIQYFNIAELVTPAEIATINGSLQDCIIDVQGDIFLLQGSVMNPPVCLVKRIGTGIGEEIVRKLFVGGVNAMLSIESQQNMHEPLPPFVQIQDSMSFDAVTQQNYEDQHFDFKHGPYGVYYREIFFHTPFLIADHLNSQGRFEDAQRWYHYIFNPTSGDVTDPPQDHNWRYLEFRNPVPSLLEILTDPETIEVYKTDPFNPHAIARLRTSAYQKSIVMKYIDNLLDWADSLFSQFTMESVNEATLLYVMAAEILGPRPAELGECGEGQLKPKNYANIRQFLYGEFLLEYPATLETRALHRLFPAAEKSSLDYAYIPNKTKLPAVGKTGFDPLVGRIGNGTDEKGIFRAFDWQNMSHTVGSQMFAGKQSPLIHDPALIADFSTSLIQSVCCYSNGYDQEDPKPSEYRPIFCVPANDELLGYWDRLEDRLYKIHHCLDIDGVRRDLALFAPEIDPNLLVRMKAAGLTLEDVLGATSGNLPPYRFTYLIEKAKQYSGAVQGFGSALLSALEKKDVEELNRLRAVHEQNILKLTRQVKQWEIDVEAETCQALEQQRDSIIYRKTYYQGLVDQGLSSWETTQSVTRHTASGLQALAGAIDTIAGIVFLVPQLGSPFAMKYGGQELGNSANAWATVARDAASIAEAISASAGLEASFERRSQEWKHQAVLADKELKQIERQLVAAEIRQNIVTRDLEIQDKNIEQAKEVYDFYGDKFSSFGLYTWLSTKLLSLYRDAYQSALAMARLAEQAYRFERDDDTSVLLDTGYWDASHAGLLAGESLLIALQNMERKFIETNYRTFEIDQSISLAQIDPSALIQLREDGKCSFKIPEAAFNLYYPGQYRRMIKAVRLTIPCVTGPYTNVGTTLRLTGSQIRIEPKTGDTVLKDVPLQRSVCIATSRAQNDAGVFELNFHDERYMPYEGAGAVSSWELELPSKLRPFDYNTISDVILHISYTAKDGAGVLQNNKTFKETVEQEFVDQLAQGDLYRLISLKHEFPTAFDQLLHLTSPSQEAEFKLDRHHFPYFLLDNDLSLFKVGICLWPADQKTVSTKNLDLGITREDQKHIQNWGNLIGDRTISKIQYGDVSISGDPLGIWKLNISTGTLDANNLDDILILLTYTVPEKTN